MDSVKKVGGEQFSKCPDFGNDQLINEGVRKMNLDDFGSTLIAPDNKQRSNDGLGMQSVNKHASAGSSVTPPLQHGWNWAARTAELSRAKGKEVAVEEEDEAVDDLDEEKNDGSVDDDDDDDDYDDDDDDDDDDNYDDDDDCVGCGSDFKELGAESHESRKQHRKLKLFFELLESLTMEEMNEPERQWHCPACKDGPGATDWYTGLQSLMTHARTKGSRRVKLHRTFAEILEEELKRRGTSVVPVVEAFGQWEGLKQEIEDHDIVWPPMVVIMNTILEKDFNDKWKGMGNQELKDYFKGYASVNSKHSYGPMGHRGMSVLIFESSAVGYVEAERLHKHFLGQGTGRSAWESKGKVLFYPGGKRQLYGFLARRDDLQEFNRHCQGKSRLKFEIKSYHEMVMAPMKQMREDNQQLTWFKNKSATEQKQKEALEQSFNVLSDKHRRTAEENRILRERTRMQHEENMAEMDYQEQFFKDQIQKMQDAITTKEGQLELQEEGWKKVELSNELALNFGSLSHRDEEMTKLKELQDEEIEKFMAEKEKLKQIREGKKSELSNKYWKEVMQVEEEYNTALTKLMEKYDPHSSGGAAVSYDSALK